MSRIPEPPPILDHYLDHVLDEGGDLRDTLFRIHSGNVSPTDSKGRYLHWEKLKHIQPPDGFTPEMHWFATKAARKSGARQLPFKDTSGEHFWYCLPDTVLEGILRITEEASGALIGDPQLADGKLRATHLIKTLRDEAIYSSQIEGAATTRAVAREMLRTERKPRNASEIMIRNNYLAMQLVQECKNIPLTPTLVFTIHRVLVEDTLIPKDKAGQFREDSDNIVVTEAMGDTVLHTPPPASQLPRRLAQLCDFANGEGGFVPPVVRAIIVHFMLAYDHPFVDGNGRTARALFYWVMAKEGFWLLEHVSISGLIRKSMDSYLKAYLHTERDENDLTYFIVQQIDVIRKGIAALKRHLEKKASEMADIEQALAGSKVSGALNHRQLALMHNALRNPAGRYTVKSHQNSHGVTQQTARTDLISLAESFGLLDRNRVGRTDVYTVPADLKTRIERLK